MLRRGGGANGSSSMIKPPAKRRKRPEGAAPAQTLLAWYDAHRRDLPWRAPPGRRADPYAVWLSEIMLQQTTVATVKGYFEKFLVLWPSVEALAEAPLEDVLAAWAGLGYYARARNLIACARAVAAAGAFPREMAALQALPGIGPYTAAAIAAIAFGRPVVPVDGNVERVAARVFAIATPLPQARPALRRAAALLGAQPAAAARPGDFAQALFDLGATVCTPARPACGLCPWRRACQGEAQGVAGTLPRQPPRRARPRRHGVHFYLRDTAGQVLLRRRPPQGLLGGMLALPGPEWRPAPWAEAEVAAAAPMPAAWRHAGEARHGLTHFELVMQVFTATVPRIAAEGVLHPAATLREAGLPSAMRRCVALAEARLATPD